MKQTYKVNSEAQEAHQIRLFFVVRQNQVLLFDFSSHTKNFEYNLVSEQFFFQN